MTKQLFAQLDDFAAERVCGGAAPNGKATFFTPTVSWDDSLGLIAGELENSEVGSLTWDGTFKQHSAKGANNMNGSVSNNIYTYSQASVTAGSKGDVLDSGLTKITYFYTTYENVSGSAELDNPLN